GRRAELGEAAHGAWRPHGARPARGGRALEQEADGRDRGQDRAGAPRRVLSDRGRLPAPEAGGHGLTDVWPPGHHAGRDAGGRRRLYGESRGEATPGAAGGDGADRVPDNESVQEG